MKSRGRQASCTVLPCVLSLEYNSIKTKTIDTICQVLRYPKLSVPFFTAPLLVMWLVELPLGITTHSDR